METGSFQCLDFVTRTRADQFLSLAELPQLIGVPMLGDHIEPKRLVVLAVPSGPGLADVKRVSDGGLEPY